MKAARTSGPTGTLPSPRPVDSGERSQVARKSVACVVPVKFASRTGGGLFSSNTVIAGVNSQRRRSSDEDALKASTRTARGSSLDKAPAVIATLEDRKNWLISYHRVEEAHTSTPQRAQPGTSSSTSCPKYLRMVFSLRCNDSCAACLPLSRKPARADVNTAGPST